MAEAACVSHEMEMQAECGSLNLHSRATSEYSWHYLWSVLYQGQSKICSQYKAQ